MPKWSMAVKQNPFILAIITSVMIWSFSDHNGNGVMDDGESYAPGRYAIHRVAADGAVSLVEVRYPAGAPYRLQLAEGDAAEAITGCGVWPVAGDVAYVPVVCGAVLLPLVSR